MSHGVEIHTLQLLVALSILFGVLADLVRCKGERKVVNANKSQTDGKDSY